MIFRSSSALVAILALSTADAFGIRTIFHQKSASIGFPVTSLGMSDEGTTEPADTPSAEGDDSAEAPAADVNDILSSPAFLKRKLEVLESDIATTEEELVAATERKEIAKEEWGPQIEALQREYTNIQQRMTEQNQVGDSDAKVRVVKGILDLLDNFDRASGVIVAETEVEQTIEAGYKQAYQDILDQFAEMGVTEVETLGTEFDYELHQAVMQMPGTEYEEGVVCKEFQKGFIMDESLIRPAMVAVAL
uniref:GrpE protein homolog n=1 Tax=Pseudo-nitzschia australis TaxID=44445 RepID=A0A7S4AM71_9STRA|mmetsp:Transcript_10900/g.23222  ORF Transcript_10900/g.23222 Transcript_10900/m.23222 type:complete len:249 (+) Transcript_10900:174-920(+)|eukprot:CAMPEP_0168180578 /NCGR_PEP_ID=MMETSP0139_2-20121125/10628_1 /TAXON_ID=44445 /ORGANISM="Pseudo-nitzschia australis, Strain 10249 10 AB" /LENGTH=248 /DNA_ID=CAMNT_0008100837 /DNA_START=173 /DNA_END=919 /DNA_ORIENTATION=-